MAGEPTDDRERLQGMRDVAEAARPGDIAALWSSEADYRWLLSKVADIQARVRALAPLDIGGLNEADEWEPHIVIDRAAVLAIIELDREVPNGR